MFEIDLSPTYFWSVEFQVPKPDGSGFLACVVDAQFARLDTDQLDELRERVRTQMMTDRAIARELVKGWRGVVDAKGDDVPFGPGAFEKWQKIPGVAAATVNAFFGSLSQAAEKN